MPSIRARNGRTLPVGAGEVVEFYGVQRDGRAVYLMDSLAEAETYAGNWQVVKVILTAHVQPVEP